METIPLPAKQGCQLSKLKGALPPLQDKWMLVQVTCETKTHPLPQHLHHASLMASLALEQSRLVWVSDIISNVIVCLQRGSQFHQGALLAITSWNKTTLLYLSDPVFPASQPAGGRSRWAQWPWRTMEVYAHVCTAVSVRTLIKPKHTKPLTTLWRFATHNVLIFSKWTHSPYTETEQNNTHTHTRVWWL